MVTRLTSIRALEWLPFWILEVLTSGLAPRKLEVQRSCVRKFTLARVFSVFLPSVRMLGSRKKSFPLS